MKKAAFLLIALLMALTVVEATAQTVSRGPRTLTVSKSQGLSESGERITVSGSGFDTEKGIYVALCVITPAELIPSPCGGGADLGGSTGSSIWVSSNPPPYGQGLAIPWGEGGTFSGTLDVGPIISPTADCRVVACAIYTRSDHLRLSDRSQDVFIPVTFGTQSPTATPTTDSVPGATATPTVPPTATPTPAPSAPTVTLLPDGRTAQAASMVLSTTKSARLDPAGETVTVTGTGYDDGQGIYVALCAVPAPGDAPGPCSGGGSNTSAWISSNPPSFGVGRAIPYGENGSFEVELELRPVIDGQTDCRVVECAITTRADDTAADDRSHDVLIPVTFAAESAATATPSPAIQATPTGSAASTPTTGEGSSDAGGSNSGGPATAWLLAGAVAAALVVAGGVFLVIRRRSGIAISIVALLALALGGCSQGDAGQPAPTVEAGADVPLVVLDERPVPQLPVRVMSADGREVTVTDTSRIVSLWGNITEVVYGLGLGSSLVARDSSATFAEVEGLPLVTRGHDTSAEGVLALNPTLVLASKDNSGPSTALNQIRNVGIPVIVFEDPQGVQDIAPRIRAIAAALGVPAAGEELVALTEGRIAKSQAAIPGGVTPPRVAFLYMRGTAGVYLLAGPGSGADSMIEAAGAIDAGTAMGLSRAFTPITSEALAQAAPDIILMTTSGLQSVGGIAGLVEIPGIAQTPAGKERRIVTIEDSLLYSYGPRTDVALRVLINQIYGLTATP